MKSKNIKEYRRILVGNLFLPMVLYRIEDPDIHPTRIYTSIESHAPRLSAD